MEHEGESIIWTDFIMGGQVTATWDYSVWISFCVFASARISAIPFITAQKSQTQPITQTILHK